MPNAIQKLKLLGSLPGVSLADIKVGGDSMTAELPADIPDVDHRVCGSIDAPDAEIANATAEYLSTALDIPEADCQGYIDQHKKLFGLATGSGAYPPGCDPEYPGLHCVWYYIEWEQFNNEVKRPLNDEEFQSIIDARVWGPSGDHRDRPFTMNELKDMWGGKPTYEVVLDFTEETYRRYGVILKRVMTGSNGQHNIHIKSLPIPGSTIGIGWFPGADPCPGDHVNQHIDVSYRPGFQGSVGLSVHETGHCLGLRHQFGNQGSHQEPMSYSYRNHLFVGYSNGDSQFKLPKAPSVDVLRRYYGGEPVGKPWKGKFDGTTPSDPPTTERITLDLLRGTDSQGKPIILNEVQAFGRTFIFRPKPQV